MRKFTKDKYAFWGTSFILVVIWIIVLIYFQNIYLSNYANYINYKEETLNKAVNSIISGYSNFSNFIFQSSLDDEKIQEIMWKVQSYDDAEKDELRNELFNIVSIDYDIITDYNFNQLQFHEVGGISFLRANSPSQYGDSLTEIRRSIDLVNEKHTAVEGFEIGRLVDGYRYVYPLFYNEKFVGSVELDLSMNMIISELYEICTDKDMGFIIEKDKIENTVYLDSQGNYDESYISDTYVTDKEIISTTNSQLNNPKLFIDENFVDLLQKSFSNTIQEEQSFSVTIPYNRSIYLAQFYSVQDISGESIGYIYTIGADEQFLIMQMSRNMAFFFSTIIAILIWFSIFFLNIKNKRIKELALNDPLTHIYNRNFFYEIVNRENSRAIRQNSEIYIAMLDIDNFKNVNDTYGHVTGDYVLKELVKQISLSLRNTDILARFGGEEFIILLPDTKNDDAFLVMERLRKNIYAHEFQTVGKISVSIGIAEHIPNDSIDLSIEKADTALYNAKRNGKNRTEKN